MRFFKKYLHDGDLERYRESGREYPHKDIPGRVLFLRKNGGLGKERTARRVEAPALRQRIGRFGADIGAVTAHKEGELAGLQLPYAVLVGEGELVEVEGKTYCPGLAGEERHAADADELLHGAHDGGDNIPPIELNDLIAIHGACVPHRDTGVAPAIRRNGKTEALIGE